MPEGAEGFSPLKTGAKNRSLQARIGATPTGTIAILGVMMVMIAVVRIGVMSAGVMNLGVMRAVAVMLMGSEGRAGKHHQQEHGGKNLLHGTNVPRGRNRR